MLQKILRDGVVTYKDFPYSPTECNKQPSVDLIHRARQARKNNYEVVRISDIHSMKKILSDGISLIISMRIGSGFANITRYDLYKGRKFKDVPVWQIFGEKISDAHAMLVVGYDDGIRAFKVLNSWGDEFGYRGYIWITYDLLNPSMNYFCFATKKIVNEFPSTSDRLAKRETSAILTDSIAGIIQGDSIEARNYENTLSTWLKTGYFRPYDDFRIVLADLDVSKQCAAIEIRDDKYQVVRQFIVDLNTSKTFYVNDEKYEFVFTNIGKAGYNRLNRAAFFSISKLSVRR
jgi:hypothetical protein